MSSSRTNPRRRRSMLSTPSARLLTGALLAVALGVAIGWLVFRDGDGSPQGAATTPAATGAGPTVRANQFGLRFQRPAGWTTAIKEEVFNISSADSTVSVAVAMLPGRPDAREVRGEDRVELKDLFDAKELDRRRFAVGPLPTLVTELSGRTEAGRDIRILSMAVSSKWRTYSFSVFSSPQLERFRALELQSLIASFEFSKPS